MNKELVKNAFLSGIWAIEPNWLQSAYSVIQGWNNKDDFQAEESLFASIKGTKTEGTRYMVIPENTRVAVIEIWGAIFPRSTWMSYYSGGTSCELLTKDIKYALNNPSIDSILFLIHSPGGEVTGISEVADLIFKNRSKKPMTAYCYGMCCSAAFWIGTACGDMVANKTARIGSIGVYSCYTDSTERLKLLGLKEIEFRNEQSPNKNLPLTEKKGQQLYQKQINDLGAIFFADVARNRGISVKKVETDFGGGDCFIGKAAVEAGLIDRIGNFDYALGLLNGDQVFADDEEDISDDELDEVIDDEEFDDEELSERKTEPQTLNSETNLDSENNGESADFNKSEENMSEATETNKQVAVIGAEPTAGNDADLLARIEQLEKDKAEKDAQIESLQVSAKKKELVDKCKEIAVDFAGNKEEKTEFLSKLAESFGFDSPEVQSYIKDQKATAEQLEKGNLFAEKGASGAEGTTASEKLNKKAQVIAEAENIPFADAMVKAAEQNPELYSAYKTEIEG